MVSAVKLTLLVAALSGSAWAAPGNVVQASYGTVNMPFSQGLSNTFFALPSGGYVDASGDVIDGSTLAAPFKASQPQSTGVFNFYDDYTFTMPSSTAGSLTGSAVSVSFAALLGIQNLQVRLYDISTMPLSTGSAGASLVSGWSVPTSVGASTVTVSTFENPVMLAASHTYALEVRGLAFGPTASYGGNLNITPVPEAEGWALAMMGLGLLGWAGRRWRQQA